MGRGGGWCSPKTSAIVLHASRLGVTGCLCFGANLTNIVEEEWLRWRTLGRRPRGKPTRQCILLTLVSLPARHTYGKQNCSLAYFFPRLPEAVILVVLMRSPMYFCRNLLLLSSLSCSSRTASMRLKMVMRESCKSLACLRISSLASLPSLSMSSLVRRGLIARTSSGPKGASTGPTALLSRGTTRGPLLFLLGRRGRTGIG